ncbi:MAG TPA: hypothetical protein VF893_00100 [Candidatus Bathyarchaeia archaeon]
MTQNQVVGKKSFGIAGRSYKRCQTMNFSMLNEKNLNKTQIVRLILNKDSEQALAMLANHYSVTIPNLKVGLPKGHRQRAFGCYTPKNQTISVLDSDTLANPFVILHEFYHHLRSKSVDKKHRGTEKNADRFAAEFLRQFQDSNRNMTS